MKNLITLCLLIIILVVTGCGNASGNGSLNTPVIYRVTPTDSNSAANSVDANGNITVTLTGINFGSKEHGEVWYNGYQSETDSNGQSMRMTLAYGGHWTDNEISINLVKTTRETYPNGSFFVVANGRQSPNTARYNFGVSNLSQATVTSVSPKVFNSYDFNSNRYMTITGTGFGTVKKSLTLFNMSGNTSLDRPIEALSWSDTSITFFIPDNLVDVTANIGIKETETGAMLGNSPDSSFRYVVFNPNISSVSPNQAYPGQTVILHSYTGGFGASQPSNFYLSVNDVIITNILSWSDSSISFAIPENTNFAPGQASIRMQVNNKAITNNSALVLVPHIKSVTVYKDSGILSSTYTYTISGYCFNGNTTLSIDNSPSITIKNYSSSSIVFSSNTDLANRGLYLGSGNYQSNTYYLPAVP